jgi:hypothetical protein
MMYRMIAESGQVSEPFARVCIGFQPYSQPFKCERSVWVA